jgi:hypothetical protein
LPLLRVAIDSEELHAASRRLDPAMRASAKSRGWRRSADTGCLGLAVGVMFCGSCMVAFLKVEPES